MKVQIAHISLKTYMPHQWAQRICYCYTPIHHLQFHFTIPKAVLPHGEKVAFFTSIWVINEAYSNYIEKKMIPKTIGRQ